MDPRLVDISLTAEDREPTDVYKDQMSVICDNLIYGYFRDPQQTDAMLRRDGLTKAADQLIRIFGPEWWTKL